MGNRESLLETAGLQFFSKMTAANSHEIKNALAIINENAGLLEDLVMMAAKGRPLAPDRLNLIAAKIRQQVARADQLTKSSNRLAHSLDAAQGPTDLVKAVGLAIFLAQRFAAMAQVKIEIAPGPTEISLPVSTFQLLNLIWVVMEFALKRVASGGTLTLRLEKSPQAAELRFGPMIDNQKSAVAKLKSTPEVAALTETLTCNIDFEPHPAAIILKFWK